MTPLILTFVSHFGEMGSRWGFNRTVGQVYALLFVAEHPLHADEIAEHLSFSRSNVSIGLKELQGWADTADVHPATARIFRHVRVEDFPGGAAERPREVAPTRGAARR